MYGSAICAVVLDLWVCNMRSICWLYGSQNMKLLLTLWVCSTCFPLVLTTLKLI
jgi:hypothetical protein